MNVFDYFEKKKDKLQHPDEVRKAISDLYELRGSFGDTWKYCVEKLCADVKYKDLENLIRMDYDNIPLSEPTFWQRLTGKQPNNIPVSPLLLRAQVYEQFQYNEGEIDRAISATVRAEILSIIRKYDDFENACHLLNDGGEGITLGELKSVEYNDKIERAINFDLSEIKKKVDTLETTQDKLIYLYQQERDYIQEYPAEHNNKFLLQIRAEIDYLAKTTQIKTENSIKNNKEKQENTEKTQRTFAGYLHHKNKEALIEKLHELLDGQKGKNVAIVIRALTELAYINIKGNELYRVMQEEFGEIGAISNINDFLNPDKKQHLTETDIKGTVEILRKV